MSSKKDFSLGQYYSQLEKYEAGSKATLLRKDSSASSLARDPFKQQPTTASKLIKESAVPERHKILLDKQKPALEKFDRVNLELQKRGRPDEERRFGPLLAGSLEQSKVSRKWEQVEKENVDFTAKEERSFVEHCSQLYGLRGQDSVAEDIALEINKRDEVYQVVRGQFAASAEQELPAALQAHFEEHQLMQRVIAEFKAISRLETTDLNELYYFLKTDR